MVFNLKLIIVHTAMCYKSKIMINKKGVSNIETPFQWC
jgi:hypothetical protein